ncbi:glycosyltransferase [Neolewinella aurantiaca]|uniref:Glycosyltransferase n=1 Tax=Neolewinella aurantiaca TaxID=2602767 RepID=A0A5C7FJ41_9BACT|nr:glycosyltransferase [Neolewinella aurantiaca]TXF85436.1 glycosyltransferase [Neolewinella aurantiaca]
MIWLASFPRSGNTFFRNVLHEVYGLTSSTYHQDPDREVDYNFTNYPVVKTHLLPEKLPQELKDLPAVYLIRDGRDSLVSIAHHRKDIVAPGTDFYNNLLEATLAQNGSFFGGWSENVQQWTKKAAIIIRFEDLISDPIREVEKLRSIIDLPAPNHSKLPTFQSLRNGQPAYGGGKGEAFSAERVKKHFRSGKVGGWKNEVPPELQRLLTNIHGATLHQFGYLEATEHKLPPSRRIIIEASKLSTTDNDGIKRYLTGLSQGLAPLLPHFPHLDISMVDNFGVVQFESQQPIVAKEQQATSEEKAVLTDRRTMSYEKSLLLLKLYIKKVLPSSVYRPIASLYRNGPFRRYLNSFKNVARNTATGMGWAPIQEIIQSTDLIHIPLPQHFDFLPHEGKRVLLTVHDFSHLLFPEYHEDLNVESAEKGMQSAIAARASFLSVSSATEDDLKRLYQPPAESLHLVPEAADTDFFNTEAAKTNPANVFMEYGIPSSPYLMCLSTIEPRKNLANTIKAFLQLKQDNPDLDCNLVVCGKKGWKTDEIFADLPADLPGVIFTGFVNDADLPVLYAHARALCYVSFYEGFGLPIVEAMSCGTPTIYGNNSSLPEVAGDGGIGVDPNDLPEIAAAMHQMLTDNDFHAQKSDAAWRQANKFSWLKTALLTINAYENILNDTP